MGTKINNALIVGISLFVIIVVIYLAVHLHRSNTTEAITQFSNYETLMARRINDQLEMFIRARKRGLLMLSRFGSVQFQDRDQLARDIGAYFKHLKKLDVREVTLLNKNGAVLFSTTESKIGRKYNEQDFWTWVLRSENKNEFLLRPLAGTARRSLTSNDPPQKIQFLLIKSVYQEVREADYPDPSGKFMGALFLDLDLESVLEKELLSWKSKIGPYQVFVIDQSGMLLLSTVHPQMGGRHISQVKNCLQCHRNFDYVFQLLQQKQGTIESQSSSEERKLIAFTPLELANASWITAISIPKEEVSGFISRNLAYTLLLIGVVALAIISSSYALHRNYKHVMTVKEEAKHLKEKQSLMEEIEQTKKYLESILNNSLEMICTLKRDGRFGFINPQLEKTTGYSKHEFAGMRFVTLVPSRQQNTWKNIWKEVLEGNTGTYEIEIKKKDGSLITCLFSQSFVRGFDEILVILNDVTQRRQVEKQIKRSKEFVETVLNSMPDAISIIDINNFKIAGCNQAFLDQYGFAEESEVLGHCCYSITHHRATPCSPPEDVCPLLEVVKEKKHCTEEHIHYDQNGNKIYAEVSASPICNDRGEIDRVVHISRDISERKQSEKKQEVLYHIAQATSVTSNLKELLTIIHQQLSTLIDTTNFFVALYDQPTDMYSFPYFVDKYDEGKDFPPQQLRKSMTDYVRRTGTPILITDEQIHELTEQGEVELVGTLSPIWMGVPLKTPQGIIGVVVVQSYTNPFAYSDQDLELLTYVSDNIAMAIARKTSEENRTQLLQELESVNRELKDFAYIVSHDLKAPLRGIGSLADWLHNDYEEVLDEEGKELIKLLESRVKRMNNLIDGVLQYSRLGRLQEEKVAVNLNQTIEEVIELLAPPENIEVKVENELPTILVEKTRIEQVFQNLISNAIKYMDKPDGKIHIGCMKKNGDWQFKVSDNGPGIDPRYHQKIFQIFQTLAARDENESTGVGLSLVKKIIEMYGGKIWVESEVGSGSMFYFTLPGNKTISQEA